MRDWDWFEDEDDFDDDLIEPYTIYWLPVIPYDMGRVSKWTNTRWLEIDVNSEETYVFWDAEMDGIEKSEWASRTARMCFEAPMLAVWEYVDEEVREIISPEYKELERAEDDDDD